MTTLQLGIDLGTTNSLIAQFIDGETKLIPNRLGHFLTPSVVSMAEDGTILVGLAAESVYLRLQVILLPHLNVLWVQINVFI